MTLRTLRAWLRRRWAPFAYKAGYVDGYHDAVRSDRRRQS